MPNFLNNSISFIFFQRVIVFCGYKYPYNLIFSYAFNFFVNIFNLNSASYLRNISKKLVFYVFVEYLLVLVVKCVQIIFANFHQTILKIVFNALVPILNEYCRQNFSFKHNLWNRLIFVSFIKWFQYFIKLQMSKLFNSFNLLHQFLHN